MIDDRLIRWVLTVVLVISVAASMTWHLDEYLTPHIDRGRYEKIILAGKYVRDHGWTEPIYVSYGDPGLWFWSLDRSYFGREAGLHYTYYGKIQDLYFLAPPLGEDSYRLDAPMEKGTAQRNGEELASRFGDDFAAIRQRPIVFLSPESYSLALSEVFVPRFHLGDGVYVIPPDSLTESEVNEWRLFCGTDYVTRNAGYTLEANWSLAPTVLEWFEPSPNMTLTASYRFGSSLSTTYSITIRIMDYPSEYNSSASYAPLSFYLDGQLASRHSYGGRGPIELDLLVGSLRPGIHLLEIRTEARGMPVIATLDTISVIPAQNPAGRATG